jgi:hypothetical protein
MSQVTIGREKGYSRHGGKEMMRKKVGCLRDIVVMVVASDRGEKAMGCETINLMTMAKKAGEDRGR